MYSQEELAFELLTMAIRANNDKIKIEELEEKIKVLEGKEPYGTVVHYQSNASIFYPWSEGMPCFDNAIERKIVYLA